MRRCALHLPAHMASAAHALLQRAFEQSGQSQGPVSMRNTWGASWELVGVPASPLDFTFSDLFGNVLTARCTPSRHLKLSQVRTELLHGLMRVTSIIQLPRCSTLLPWHVCRNMAIEAGEPGLYPTDCQFHADVTISAPAPGWSWLAPQLTSPFYPPTASKGECSISDHHIMFMQVCGLSQCW